MPAQTAETLQKGRKRKGGGFSAQLPIKADQERMLSMAALVAMQPDSTDAEIAEVMGVPEATIEAWRVDEWFLKQLKIIATQNRLKPVLQTLKWKKLEEAIPDVLAKAFEDESEIPYALKLRAIEIVGDRGPSGQYAKRTRTEVHHTHEVTGVDMAAMHEHALTHGHGPKQYIEVVPEEGALTVAREQGNTECQKSLAETT